MNVKFGGVEKNLGSAGRKSLEKIRLVS